MMMMMMMIFNYFLLISDCIEKFDTDIFLHFNKINL